MRNAPAVKYELPPAHSSGHLSMSMTFPAPDCAADMAAQKPAFPPPTTTTSQSMVVFEGGDAMLIAEDKKRHDRIEAFLMGRNQKGSSLAFIDSTITIKPLVAMRECPMASFATAKSLESKDRRPSDSYLPTLRISLASLSSDDPPRNQATPQTCHIHHKNDKPFA